MVMKAFTNDDKSKVDCQIKIDGNAAQEYNNSTSTDGAFCTWVPVQAGQKITVDAGCTVDTKEVQFDLVVDGIIRNSLSSTAKARTSKRHVAKFASCFRMSGSALEANLVVKDLPTEEWPEIQADDADTVGSIEVRVWVLQVDNQERHLQTTKGFDTCRNWKELTEEPTYTAITPKHEIELVESGFNPPSPARVTVTKKRISSARAGSKPWATFRFFYRNQGVFNMSKAFLS
jgi:hypothetical protein